MQQKDNRAYIDANRIGWEEAETIHRQATFDHLKKAFQNPQFIYLNKTALGAFRQIGVKEKAVVQLMCNNGRELLSLKRMGAARCVGFDFSKKFLSQGVELSDSTNLECDFVYCDVFQIPTTYNNQFDIVFISSGSLRWVPDLNLFFTVIKRLLRHSGILLMTEMHPILNIIDDNESGSEINSYFRAKPFKQTKGLDYWRDQAYEASPVYYFQHTLAEIINQCITHKMELLHFSEHAMDLSGGRYSKNKDCTNLPLSFLLVAKNG